MPRSVILALNLSSRRMLVDLMSRWRMRGAAASCRYSSPLAAPSATLTRVCQSMGFLPRFRSRQSLRLPLAMHSNTSSRSSCRPWLSEQYPSNGTTWQWFSLDSSSISDRNSKSSSVPPSGLSFFTATTLPSPSWPRYTLLDPPTPIRWSSENLPVACSSSAYENRATTPGNAPLSPPQMTRLQLHRNSFRPPSFGLGFIWGSGDDRLLTRFDLLLQLVVYLSKEYICDRGERASLRRK
uniref:Uncharacterized protein n=1 Tax=Zea mays TaxID=4577 RepID=C4J2K8_MAIZE|nr:unknown [Zea mays]ACR35898.1 unknown [Zea mays]